MTEVITLSDDDDDCQIENGPYINNERHDHGATVHIRETSQINLSALGIFSSIRTSSTPQNNRQKVAPKIRENGNIFDDTFEIHLSPVTKQKREIGTSTNLINPQPPKRLRVSIEPTAKSEHGSSISRTFESYEANQPQRRSNRVSKKPNIHGKFVCKYDARKCVKVISGTVEFINHLWSHVCYDEPKKRIGEVSLCQSADPHDPAAVFLQQLSTCQFCMTKYRKAYQKQLHVQKCHLSLPKEDFICHTCEVEVPSTFVQNHMAQHRDNEAPYHCRKCKYRTSVRVFMYQHYAEKHNTETLMCPICLFQTDLPTNARHRRLIFVNQFVDHMKAHTQTQHRCPSCSLTFSDVSDLRFHVTKDHVTIPMGWIAKDRPFRVNETPKIKVPKLSKISSLQKKYFKTLEGRRIDDEVACGSGVERPGIDTSSASNTMYKCECGDLMTFNGNRVASHYHRCRKALLETVKECGKKFEGDNEEEMKIFAVFPPFSETETRRKNKKRDKRKKEDEEKKGELKIEVVKRSPPPKNTLFKCLESSEEMNERIANILAAYKGDK